MMDNIEARVFMILANVRWAPTGAIERRLESGWGADGRLVRHDLLALRVKFDSVNVWMSI